MVLTCHLCKASFHQKCVNLSKREYIRSSKKKSCFTCDKCLFNLPFSSLTNDELKLTNFGFNNEFSSDTKVFPDETPRRFFDNCNEINLFVNNEYDSNIYTNSKYYDINEFNNLNINNNDLGILHLNIASLRKHMDDSPKFFVTA